MNTQDKTNTKASAQPENVRVPRPDEWNPFEAAKASAPETLEWHINDLNPYEIRVGDGINSRRIADCREANCICYTEGDTANARLIVASVNNADKLAEALSGLTSEVNLNKLNIRKDFSLMNAHAHACKQLHEYQNAKGGASNEKT